MIKAQSDDMARLQANAEKFLMQLNLKQVEMNDIITKLNKCKQEKSILKAQLTATQKSLIDEKIQCNNVNLYLKQAQNELQTIRDEHNALKEKCGMFDYNRLLILSGSCIVCFNWFDLWCVDELHGRYAVFYACMASI